MEGRIRVLHVIVGLAGAVLGSWLGWGAGVVVGLFYKERPLN